MFRRLVMIGVIVVLSLVVVSVPASAKTVAPSTWAPKFCADLHSWNTKLNSDGAAASAALSGQVTNLKAAKTQLETFLNKSVANTKHAVQTLLKAGIPKTPNGAKIAAKFVNALKSAQSLFASAESMAASLSTSNLSTFEATAQKITASLGKGGEALSTSFQDVSKLDTGHALSRVLQATPACAFLGGASGTSSATTTTG